MAKGKTESSVREEFRVHKGSCTSRTRTRNGGYTFPQERGLSAIVQLKISYMATVFCGPVEQGPDERRMKNEDIVNEEVSLWAFYAFVSLVPRYYDLPMFQWFPGTTSRFFWPLGSRHTTNSANCCDPSYPSPPNLIQPFIKIRPAIHLFFFFVVCLVDTCTTGGCD